MRAVNGRLSIEYACAPRIPLRNLYPHNLPLSGWYCVDVGDVEVAVQAEGLVV